MADFSSIVDLATKIKGDLVEQTDKKSIALLYAFNATGKTRLSVEFDELNNNDDGQIKVLSYNAFLEDLFVWDNDKFVLNFSPSDWRIDFVLRQEGLESRIIESYRLLANTKVEPEFVIKHKNARTGKFEIGRARSGEEEIGEVTFVNLIDGSENTEQIKISKSEESLLIWSVFHSILEAAIEELNMNEEERSTDIFNHLEYIVIDDPVSSIDDERIISLAVKLLKVVKLHKSEGVNFLITTHHALFFNVLFNSFRKLPRADAKKYFYIFSKNENTLTLEDQHSDSPFAYHLLIKNKIQEAIKNDGLEKYHFNLLRTLLEKTSNFLGYAQWSDCVLGEETKEEVKRLVNLYSHSKLSELESGSLSNADKELFTEAFNAFMEDFKYQ